MDVFSRTTTCARSSPPASRSTATRLLGELERQDDEPQASGRFVVELDGEPAGNAGVRAHEPAQQDRALRRARRSSALSRPPPGGHAARIFQRHLIFDLGYHRLEMVVYGFNEQGATPCRARRLDQGGRQAQGVPARRRVGRRRHVRADARRSRTMTLLDEHVKRFNAGRPLRRLRADARELRRRRDDGVRRRSRRAVRREGRDRARRIARSLPTTSSTCSTSARTATRSSRATRGGVSRTVRAGELAADGRRRADHAGSSSRSSGRGSRRSGSLRSRSRTSPRNRRSRSHHCRRCSCPSSGSDRSPAAPWGRRRCRR